MGLKRQPPLAVGVIGTGAASAKIVTAALTDFTANYPDVAFILPVTDDHWSDAIGVTHEWLVANDVPYVAVTTSDSVGKALAPVLEGAAETHKVARVSSKVVSLLQAEKGEGDVALFVGWDDEDAEAAAAVQKALGADVPALDFTNGLEPFTFDDDEDAETEGDGPTDLEAGLQDDSGSGDPELEEIQQQASAADEYDDWGVRKLRAALRERSSEHDIPDRTIGQLEKDDAIRALRNIDNGKGKSLPGVEQAAAEEPAPRTVRESDKPDEDVAAVLDESIGSESRTTRARRAFAEGAAEGTGDEAQTLPNSRGGDVLETETDEPSEAAVFGDQPELADDMAALVPVDADWQEQGLRREALVLAIQAGAGAQEALSTARAFEAYLRGQSRGPGRPRKDGSPALPREVDPETGKRRRVG